MKRLMLFAATLLVFALPAAASAGAQPYPSRTVSVVVPLTVPEVAVMVVEPVVSVEARPVLEMVAIVTSDEVHPTEVVRICVDPSE